jgi:hypothetical protein
LRWSLLVTAWFAGAPLLFRTLVDPEPLRRVLNDSVPDVVLFTAVLLLGEAVRNRRALDLERKKSERLLRAVHGRGDRHNAGREPRFDLPPPHSF